MWGKKKRRALTGAPFFVCNLRENHVNYFLAFDSTVKFGLAHSAESNRTFLHSEEGVVGSHFYVLASFNLSTALADDDLASLDLLAMIALYTEVFWL